jgi:cytochrome P450
MLATELSQRDTRKTPIFTDALDFDIDRKNGRDHTTFGLGIRTCPGNMLARAELVLSVESWLREFASVEFAVPLKQIHYEPIFVFRAIGSMPLRATRAETNLS